MPAPIRKKTERFYSVAVVGGPTQRTETQASVRNQRQRIYEQQTPMMEEMATGGVDSIVERNRAGNGNGSLCDVVLFCSCFASKWGERG